MDDAFISTIAERLRDVPGISAVVLGGSRGRGTARPDSDYDLGIYFDSPDAFDIATLNRIAQDLDDEHRADLCTPIGGWGLWVVGGGWLRVDGAPVDFIYRELPRVRRVVDDCLVGKVETGSQAGHPFGFVSATYMGEVATCRVLWERDGALAALKSKTQPYPPALKRALLDKRWEAGFCAAIAEKPARRGDLNYVTGALFRGTTSLALALFGLNAQWWLNEKGAVELAGSFLFSPLRFAERVNDMIAVAGVDAPRAVAMLAELDREVTALCEARS
jgi:predicted nucleotidyltransferase